MGAAEVIAFEGSCPPTLRLIPPIQTSDTMAPYATIMRGAMLPHHIYYQLAIVGLLECGVMLPSMWPSHGAVSLQPPVQPVPPQCPRQ